MLKKGKILWNICSELRNYCNCIPQFILAAAAGVAFIIFGWTKFGGPCRITLLFKIPGGGFTIGLYYVLWFIMFMLFGCELIMHLQMLKWIGKKPLLLHIASHLLMYLWYPLFFTSFSQFFALLILISSMILLITELAEMYKYSVVLSLLLIFKTLITVLYVVINLSFLIIN